MGGSRMRGGTESDVVRSRSWQMRPRLGDLLLPPNQFLSHLPRSSRQMLGPRLAVGAGKSIAWNVHAAAPASQARARGSVSDPVHHYGLSHRS